MQGLKVHREESWDKQAATGFGQILGSFGEFKIGLDHLFSARPIPSWFRQGLSWVLPDSSSAEFKPVSTRLGLLRRDFKSVSAAT